MQPLFLLAIRCGGGGGGGGRFQVRDGFVALNLTVPLGSGRVRRSQVRASL